MGHVRPGPESRGPDVWDCSHISAVLVLAWLPIPFGAVAPITARHQLFMATNGVHP